MVGNGRRWLEMVEIVGIFDRLLLPMERWMLFMD